MNTKDFLKTELDKIDKNIFYEIDGYGNIEHIVDVMNLYADAVNKKCNIPRVIKSVCDDCTAYPFDERGKTPLCSTCKDNPKQTVL